MEDKNLHLPFVDNPSLKHQIFSLISLSSSSSSTSSTSSTSRSSSYKISSLYNLPCQLQSTSNFTLTNTTNNYIFVLDAWVNGFAQLKLSAEKIDFEFIVEIFWSDESRTFVKRTFDDFVLFDRKLMEKFGTFFSKLKIVNDTMQSGTDTSARYADKYSKFGQCLDGELSMPVLPCKFN
jgi:hypothetical protein